MGPVKLGIITFGEFCVWTVRIITCLKAMPLQAGIEKLKIKGRVQVIFNPLIQRLPVIAAIKVQMPCIATLTYRSMKCSGSYGMLCMLLKHSLLCNRVDGAHL